MTLLGSCQVEIESWGAWSLRDTDAVLMLLFGGFLLSRLMSDLGLASIWEVVKV